jgi:hypothetical protein
VELHAALRELEDLEVEAAVAAGIPDEGFIEDEFAFLGFDSP